MATQTREKIMSVLFEEGNELWLFDPYFTDTGSGDTKMIDWLFFCCTKY